MPDREWVLVWKYSKTPYLVTDKVTRRPRPFAVYGSEAEAQEAAINLFHNLNYLLEAEEMRRLIPRPKVSSA